MSNVKIKKGKLRSNGKEVVVYQSTVRQDFYIDFSDCTTEYHKDDIIFYE